MGRWDRVVDVYGVSSFLNILVAFVGTVILGLPSFLTDNRFTIDAGIGFYLACLYAFSLPGVLIVCYMMVTISPLIYHINIMKKNKPKWLIGYVILRLAEGVILATVVRTLGFNVMLLMMIAILHTLIDLFYVQLIRFKHNKFAPGVSISLLLRSLLPNIIFIIFLMPVIKNLFIV